jgi:hypothetical protein
VIAQKPVERWFRKKLSRRRRDKARKKIVGASGRSPQRMSLNDERDNHARMTEENRS